MARINDQLARHLNFPKFWAQDREFSLRLSPREFDLVFTIQDRTGTEYTFAERSHGLKYFLSYLIQARTRKPVTGRSEILLMDEPDAYLSAEAQQDLLKIFDAFAEPEDGATPVQVIYVTHSPFLLDKNHAQRIRVLEKGKAADGTRVIRSASRNHYEPLRSAFGAYIGETAFIGACNLLVEGPADQVLLAEASRLIRMNSATARSDSLDLNRIVIVPCGSAKQIPYMVYLIRGRDTEKPPVIALLDADPEGLAAAAVLRGGEPKIGRLIKRDYIVDVSEVGPVDGGRSPLEIEDLAPRVLALRAANAYFREVLEFRETEIRIEDNHFPIAMPTGKSIYDELNRVAREAGSHIDKVGFARALIRECEAGIGRDNAVGVFLDRMRALFRLLTAKQRYAERDASKHRIGSHIERLRANFTRDHPDAATREQALIFFEDVQAILDNTGEAEEIKTKILAIRRTFELDDEPMAPIQDFDGFAVALSGLRYSHEHKQMSEEMPKETTKGPSTTPKEPRRPRNTSARRKPRGQSLKPIQDS